MVVYHHVSVNSKFAMPYSFLHATEKEKMKWNDEETFSILRTQYLLVHMCCMARFGAVIRKQLLLLVAVERRGSSCGICTMKHNGGDRHTKKPTLFLKGVYDCPLGSQFL